MRSIRRVVPLCAICVLLLIYLLAVLLHPSETLESGISTNFAWFMEYRVINEATVLQEDRPVLIMVTSAPENVNKRNAIRRTWGSWPNVRVLYLLGVSASGSEEEQSKIERESAVHRDIVQFDFVDNYRNLTLKSCALVMWASRNSWPRRKLVIKVDDDTCVDMPLLNSIFSEFRDGVYGEYRRASKPLRCGTPGCTKWGLTLGEYGEETFPPHLQGSFYVIAESAIAKLNNSLFVPPFLFIEDVYLTGLVTRAANVTVRPMPRGTIVNPLPARTNWRVQRGLVAQHQCNVKFQQTFWDHVSKKTL